MKILVVEDHLLIGKSLRKGLTEEAFAVDWVTTLEEGIHHSGEWEYDTIILDLTLPDGSGIDLLKILRARNQRTPVLILSAKDTMEDKTLGFIHGTDDYLSKPFMFEELLFRVRALIRRKYQVYGNVLKAGKLLLDATARTAVVNDLALSLTAKEFAFLELFLMNRGHVLSRQQIISHLYASEETQESNIVDVFINKLRRKLESAGAEFAIDTVRGEGYVVR